MRGLKRLRKIREEEAAKELLEEVQDQKQQLEDEVWRERWRTTFSLGSRKEEITNPERKHLANGTEQYYKFRKSGAILLRWWQKFKNWVGKTVRGCPDARKKKRKFVIMVASLLLKQDITV